MKPLQAIQDLSRRLTEASRNERPSLLLALLGYRIPLVHALLLVLVGWGVLGLIGGDEEPSQAPATARSMPLALPSDRDTIPAPALPESGSAQSGEIPRPAEPVVAVEPAAPATAPVAAPPAEVATANQGRPASAAGLQSELWLLSQPPDHYTLQLLGTRRAETLAAFVLRHGLNGEQVAYYRTVHAGGDWYVLLYGVFPNREQAVAALARLPAEARANTPWPRSFKSVQQAIQQSAATAATLP